MTQTVEGNSRIPIPGKPKADTTTPAQTGQEQAAFWKTKQFKQVVQEIKAQPAPVNPQFYAPARAAQGQHTVARSSSVNVGRLQQALEKEDFARRLLQGGGIRSQEQAAPVGTQSIGAPKHTVRRSSTVNQARYDEELKKVLRPQVEKQVGDLGYGVSEANRQAIVDKKVADLVEKFKKPRYIMLKNNEGEPVPLYRDPADERADLQSSLRNESFFKRTWTMLTYDLANTVGKSLAWLGEPSLRLEQAATEERPDTLGAAMQLGLNSGLLGMEYLRAAIVAPWNYEKAQMLRKTAEQLKYTDPARAAEWFQRADAAQQGSSIYTGPLAQRLDQAYAAWENSLRVLQASRYYAQDDNPRLKLLKINPFQADATFEEIKQKEEEIAKVEAEAKEQAAQLRTQASEAYKKGDYQAALDLVKQAQAQDRASQYADPYGAYTWGRQPENYTAFLDDVALAEVQKGEPLTAAEIRRVKDYHTNVWTELTGQMIFDPINLIPGELMEKATGLPFKAAGKVHAELAAKVPGYGKATYFLGSPIRWLQREAVTSTANRVGRTIYNTLERVSNAYNTAEDVTRGIEDIQNAVLAARRARTLDEAKAIYEAARLKSPGMEQMTFREFKSLMDAGGAIDPTEWSRLYGDALKKAEQDILNVAERTKQDPAKLMSEFARNRRALLETADTFGKAIIDTHRIVKGSALVDDTLSGWAAKTLRELSGQEINEALHLTKADEWVKAYGKTLDPRLRGVLATSSKVLEGTLQILGFVRDVWSTVVLTTPRWILSNLPDTAMRDMVYGGDLWDDLVTLATSNHRTFADELGFVPIEFSQSLSRNGLDFAEGVSYSLLYEGWKPKFGPFSYINREFKRLLQGDEVLAKRQLMANMLGFLPENSKLRNALLWLGDGINVRMPALLLHSVPGGIADFNTAIEFTFRLRMFHREYFSLLDKLEPQFAKRGLEAVSPALRDIAAQIWRAADGNPRRISATVEHLLGKAKRGTPAQWALLVPPEIERVTAGMEAADRQLFVTSVSNALEEHIQTSLRNGKELTSADFEKFFTDYKLKFKDEIQARMSASWSVRDVDTTIDASAKAAREAPNTAASGGALPITHNPRAAAIEKATQKLGRGKPHQIAADVVKNFETAVQDFAKVERVPGNTVQRVIKDGQAVIEVGDDVLKQGAGPTYKALHEALLDTFVHVDEAQVLRGGFVSLEEYNQAVRSFITDREGPTALLNANERQFVTLTHELATHPQLKELIERTGKVKIEYEEALDLFRNTGVYSDAYGFVDPPETFLEAEAQKLRPLPGEHIAASQDMAIATEQLVKAEKAAGLSREQAEKFARFREYWDVYRKELKQLYTFTYPGPLLKSSGARHQGWELFYGMGTLEYKQEAFVKDELLKLLQTEPAKAEKYVDEALADFSSYFLKENGIELEWDANQQVLLSFKMQVNGRTHTFTEAHDLANLQRRFYTKDLYTKLSTSPLLKLRLDSRTQLTKQVASRLRTIFDLPNNRAEAWARVIDSHAQKWAEVTGQDVAKYYERLGFQRLADGSLGLATADRFRIVKRGAIQRAEDGQFIFYGLSQSNFESMVRETGELFYDDLVSMATHNDQAAQDLRSLNLYLSGTSGKPLRGTRLEQAHSDALADLFSQYVAEGMAPDIAAKGALERMKGWISATYEGVKDSPLDDEMSDDLRRVLDRLFTEQKLNDVPKANRRTIQLMAEEAGIKFVDENDLLRQINTALTPAPDVKVLTPEQQATRQGLEQVWRQAEENYRAVADEVSGMMDAADDRLQFSTMTANQPRLEQAEEALRIARQALNDFDNEMRSSYEAATQEIKQAVQQNPELAKKLGVQTPPAERRTTEVRVPDDRRKTLYQRTIDNWESLTPEEQKMTGASKWMDEATGLENKNAFLRDAVGGKDPPPGMVNTVIDGNAVTALNKHLGHAGTDSFIHAIGDQINQVVDDVLGKGNGRRFRFGGDEFAIWHDTVEQGERIGRELDERFSKFSLTIVDENGVEKTVTGLSVSHGTGETFDAADKAVYEDKITKSKQGLRPTMGPGVDKETLPPRVSISARPKPEPAGGVVEPATHVPPPEGPGSFRPYTKLGDVPKDVAIKALNIPEGIASKAPAKAAAAAAEPGISKTLQEGWDVWKTRRGLQGFPEEALATPDTFKAYLTKRMGQEWSEPAAHYNRLLWEVEQFEDAMVSYRAGKKYATVIFPRVPDAHISTGMQTWIRNNEKMLSNYESALQALDQWEVYMKQLAEKGHPGMALTKAQQAELRTWAPQASATKAEMVDLILHGGEYNGAKYTGAIDLVNKRMLDYQSRSVFDQTMKNVFPFWMFPSRSFPFWVETLATHPYLIAAYEKIQHLSRAQRFQAGAVTSKGQPLPSLDGYVLVPGTDLWVNPLAPLSFRYALDIAKSKDDILYRANTAEEDVEPKAFLAKELLQQGQVYGFTPAPWITWLMKDAYQIPDEVIPRYPLVPQISLFPRWLVSDLANKADQIALFGSQGWTDKVDAAYPEVPWHDYLVERRILEDTLYQLREGNLTEAERLKLIPAITEAIKVKGDNPLWQKTYRTISNEEATRSLTSFFTGYYPKPFTDGQADRQQLINEMNLLKSSLNNEFQATVFNLPTDAETAWQNYLGTQDTPEGWTYRLYTDIGWVTDERGQLVRNPEERAKALAQKITQDENQQAYYAKMSDLQIEYNKRLRALPVGSSWEVQQQVYQWYAEEKAKLAPLKVYEKYYGTNKPVELIQQDFRNEWFRLVLHTKPYWNVEGNETYDQYQARVTAWEANLPQIGLMLMRTWARQEDVTGTLAKLHEDQKLDPGFFSELLAQTNQAGLDQWDIENDDVFDALNGAWKATYWDAYWQAISGKDGYQVDLAEQDFLRQHPEPPTATELYAWIKARYGNRFTLEEVQKWAGETEPLSIEQRQVETKPDDYTTRQHIWTLLSYLGPGSRNQGVFNTAFVNAGGNPDALTTWYEEVGQAYTQQPEKLQELHDSLQAAILDLGLQPPNREELVRFIQAQKENEDFKTSVQQSLGSTFFDLLDYYHNLDKDGQYRFRKEEEAYATIQEYYDLKEVFADGHPTWADYYGFETTPNVPNLAEDQTTLPFQPPSTHGGPKHRRTGGKAGLAMPTQAAAAGTQKPYFYISSRTGGLSPQLRSLLGDTMAWEVDQLYRQGRPLSASGQNFLRGVAGRYPQYRDEIGKILTFKG